MTAAQLCCDVFEWAVFDCVLLGSAVLLLLCCAILYSTIHKCVGLCMLCMLWKPYMLPVHNFFTDLALPKCCLCPAAETRETTYNYAFVKEKLSAKGCPTKLKRCILKMVAKNISSRYSIEQALCDPWLLNTCQLDPQPSSSATSPTQQAQLETENNSPLPSSEQLKPEIQRKQSSGAAMHASSDGPVAPVRAVSRRPLPGPVTDTRSRAQGKAAAGNIGLLCHIEHVICVMELYCPATICLQNV